MKDNFYKKSSLLIITNITTGILSFIFSIILTRKIGAEGIGLFSLISPISNLLYSVLAGGLVLAVSKVISEYYTKKQMNNLHKSIKSTTIFNFVSALILILIAYSFSSLISKYIIKDMRTLSALRFILVAIIFMSVANIYKGYFYGTKNVFVPAFIDVFEKIMRILSLLIIFKIKNNNLIETNITISYLVFLIGEFCSFVLLYIYYKLDKRNHEITKEVSDDSIQLIYNVLAISVPLMFAELISSALYSVSALILPRRLVISGISYNEALSLIGRFAGMSLQIIFFPSIIIFSISTILIPDIASNSAKNDLYTIKKRIKQVISIAFILGIIVLILCLSLGEKLGWLLFKEANLGNYLNFLAFCAPLIYLTQVSRSILNGLGRQKFIFKYSVFFSFIQVVLLYLLVAIPKLNIYGYGITMFITSFALLIIYFRKIYQIISSY